MATMIDAELGDAVRSLRVLDNRTATLDEPMAWPEFKKQNKFAEADLDRQSELVSEYEASHLLSGVTDEAERNELLKRFRSVVGVPSERSRTTSEFIVDKARRLNIGGGNLVAGALGFAAAALDTVGAEGAADSVMAGREQIKKNVENIEARLTPQERAIRQRAQATLEEAKAGTFGELITKEVPGAVAALAQDPALALESAAGAAVTLAGGLAGIGLKGLAAAGAVMGGGDAGSQAYDKIMGLNDEAIRTAYPEETKDMTAVQLEKFKRNTAYSAMRGAIPLPAALGALSAVTGGEAALAAGVKLGGKQILKKAGADALGEFGEESATEASAGVASSKYGKNLSVAQALSDIESFAGSAQAGVLGAVSGGTTSAAVTSASNLGSKSKAGAKVAEEGAPRGEPSLKENSLGTVLTEREQFLSSLPADEEIAARKTALAKTEKTDAKIIAKIDPKAKPTPEQQEAMDRQIERVNIAEFEGQFEVSNDEKTLMSEVGLVEPEAAPESEVGMSEVGKKILKSIKKTREKLDEGSGGNSGTDTAGEPVQPAADTGTGVDATGGTNSGTGAATGTVPDATTDQVQVDDQGQPASTDTRATGVQDASNGRQAGDGNADRTVAEQEAMLRKDAELSAQAEAALEAALGEQGIETPAAKRTRKKAKAEADVQTVSDQDAETERAGRELYERYRAEVAKQMEDRRPTETAGGAGAFNQIVGAPRSNAGLRGRRPGKEKKNEPPKWQGTAVVRGAPEPVTGPFSSEHGYYIRSSDSSEFVGPFKTREHASNAAAQVNSSLGWDYKAIAVPMSEQRIIDGSPSGSSIQSVDVFSGEIGETFDDTMTREETAFDGLPAEDQQAIVDWESVEPGAPMDAARAVAADMVATKGTGTEIIVRLRAAVANAGITAVDNVVSAIVKWASAIKNLAGAVAIAISLSLSFPVADAYAADAITQPTKDYGLSAQGNAIVQWALKRGDHGGKTFVVADKPTGKIMLVSANGEVLAEAPALFGRTVGDGYRAGSTPAGAFNLQVIPTQAAGYGGTLAKFDEANGGSAIYAVHRVYLGNPAEKRIERLESPDVADNRVSAGCINVSEGFFDRHFEKLPGNTRMYVAPDNEENVRQVTGEDTPLRMRIEVNGTNKDGGALPVAGAALGGLIGRRRIKRRSFKDWLIGKKYKSVLSTEESRQMERTGIRPEIEEQGRMSKIIESYMDSQRPVVEMIRNRIGTALGPRAAQRVIDRLKLAPGVRGTYKRRVLKKFYEPILSDIKKLSDKIGHDPREVLSNVMGWITEHAVPSRNAYLMASLLKQARDPRLSNEERQKAAAHHILMGRVLNAPSSVIPVVSIPPALRKILPIKRGQLSYDVPMANSMTNAEAAAALIERQKKFGIAANVYAGFDDSIAQWNDWLTDLDVKAGILSPADVAEYRKFGRYIPLTRDLHNVGIMRANRFDQDLFAIEGSTQSYADDAFVATYQRSNSVINRLALAPFYQEIRSVRAQTPSNVDIGFMVDRGGKVTVTDPASANALQRSMIELDGALKTLESGTKLFSAFLTTYNPIFQYLVNPLLETNRIQSILHDTKVRTRSGRVPNMAGLSAAIAKNLTLTARHMRTAAQLSAGKDPTNPSSSLVELAELGGLSTLGQYLTSDREDLGADMKAILDPSLFRQLKVKVLDRMADASFGMEIAVPVAIYEALKEQGVAPSDAAAAVRRTMDLGESGASMTARLLRAAFAFANPAIKGAEDMGKYMLSLSGRNGPQAQRRAMVVQAGLIVMSIFAYALAAALGDDDEELGNSIDRRPFGEVSRGIPLRLSNGNVLTMPVAYGPASITWAMMNLGIRLAKGLVEPAEAAGEAVKTMWNTFSPLQVPEINPQRDLATFLMVAVTPSIFKPVALAMNDMNSFGIKQHTVEDKTKYRSDHGKVFSPEMYKDVAKLVRESTGIDMYPEQIQTIMRGYAGGVLGVVTQQVESESRKFTLQGHKTWWEAAISRVYKTPDVEISSRFSREWDNALEAVRKTKDRSYNEDGKTARRKKGEDVRTKEGASQADVDMTKLHDVYNKEFIALSKAANQEMRKPNPDAKELRRYGLAKIARQYEFIEAMNDIREKGKAK